MNDFMVGDLARCASMEGGFVIYEITDIDPASYRDMSRDRQVFEGTVVVNTVVAGWASEKTVGYKGAFYKDTASPTKMVYNKKREAP